MYEVKPELIVGLDVFTETSGHQDMYEYFGVDRATTRKQQRNDRVFCNLLNNAYLLADNKVRGNTHTGNDFFPEMISIYVRAYHNLESWASLGFPVPQEDFDLAFRKIAYSMMYHWADDIDVFVHRSLFVLYEEAITYGLDIYLKEDIWDLMIREKLVRNDHV